VANAITGYSGSGTTSVGLSRATPPSAHDSAVTTGGAPLQGTDEVRITDVASQLADLGHKLSALPPIDTSRVSRISQSIADGTYRISASKIASGLLQSDQALAQIGL
jgi:flagellar biosynthesis anti-sigma factor FlgM